MQLCTPNTPTALSLSHYPSFARIRILLAFYSMKMRASASAAAATETPAQLASPGAGPSDPEQRPLSAQFLLQFSIHITFSAAFLSVNAHCGNDCDSYCNYVGKQGQQAREGSTDVHGDGNGKGERNGARADGVGVA